MKMRRKTEYHKYPTQKLSKYITGEDILRLDYCRSLESGLCPSPRRDFSGEERGLISRTAAGNRASDTLGTTLGTSSFSLTLFGNGIF